MALFEAVDLHKRFGDQVVLQGVTLSVEEGRLSGIMGPNGAGKTTCFNVLTGRYRPDRGTVRVHTRVLNQEGVLVAEFKRLVLVPRKHPGEPAAAAVGPVRDAQAGQPD